MNLPELLAQKLLDPNLDPDYTIDDFFDDAELDDHLRTDFAMSCITKQALDIIQGRNIHWRFQNDK